MASRMTKRYSREVRERAVRMVLGWAGFVLDALEHEARMIGVVT